MIAMHYSIPLKSDAEIAVIIRRVAEIGPEFDGLPGLAAKAFLLGVSPPSYALYYLWQNTDAAAEFLAGPRFQALVERFGRPDVHFYDTEATALDLPVGGLIQISPNEPASRRDAIELRHPRNGTSVYLNAGSGDAFRVLYLAGPSAIMASADSCSSR